MGQFTAPQNTATIPSAAPKLAGMPSSPPIKHPNVAPDKKGGHNLTAFEAAAYGEGRKHNFQGPGPGHRRAAHGRGDHIRSCAVIVCAAQQRQNNQHCAAQQNAGIGVDQLALQQPPVLCMDTQNAMLTSAHSTESAIICKTPAGERSKASKWQSAWAANERAEKRRNPSALR